MLPIFRASFEANFRTDPPHWAVALQIWPARHSQLAKKRSFQAHPARRLAWSKEKLIPSLFLTEIYEIDRAHVEIQDVVILMTFSCITEVASSLNSDCASIPILDFGTPTRNAKHAGEGGKVGSCGTLCVPSQILNLSIWTRLFQQATPEKNRW